MLTPDGKDLLSNIQLNYLCDTIDKVIEALPGKALYQLMEGYDNDVDAMLKEMTTQAERALYLGKSLDSENLEYVENVKSSMDSTLKILSFNYFKTTMLPKFRMGWRNIEWGNLTQLFPWSCYLCSRASGKTEIAGTEVVMFDGSLKKIEDIKVGDKVMGVDSTPRVVLQTHVCEDDSYHIKQKHGLDYVVNSRHILHLQKDKFGYMEYGHGNYRKNGQEIVEISAKDFYDLPRSKQKRLYGYRINGWELSDQSLPIDPYIFGTWLGDRHSNCTKLTSADIEIIDAWKEYAESLGMKLFKLKNKYEYSLTNVEQKHGEINPVLNVLRELNVLNNKHIPDIYMRGSREQRLQLLAGILDTDGHLSSTGTIFELTLKSGSFIKQVQDLAWSLGFRTSLSSRTIKGFSRDELRISLDLHTIPTRVERKRAHQIHYRQDYRRGKIEVTKGERTKFYGFYLDGDHLYLHKDGTVVHNSFEWSYAFILWRLWSYCRPTVWRPDTIDNANRKETCYITSTMTLAKVQVAKVREEIETNDLIKEKLNPNNKASIGETGITTETGSILHVRGKDGFIRGLHVGAALCDDMPDESSLYSDEQREKMKELLKGTIEPIVEPYGYFLICGTPFSSAPNELYQLLKADKRFYCFEYPIVFPNGRPLAPDRFTFSQILEKKEELGTIVFNREYLVVPISDSSTIFPYEYLMRSIVGMENIRFASSIDEFPIKLTRVHIGVDFAVSGNIGADYTVYSVWGIDAMKNFYLLYYYRQKGMSHNEQVDKIVQLDRLFRPNKIICEANGFQSILSGLAQERGLKNIEPFTTTEGNKKDLYTGLPSLSAMFERGQIKCPYAPGETKQAVEIMFGEFASITFKSDNGKLEASSGHDDITMSAFLAINSLREDEKEVKVGITLI
jgi:hypothetical protein